MSDYKWPNRYMGRHQAERHTGPEIGPTLKWVAKRPKDVHPENGPSIEWVVNGPKFHPADIEPKYITGC